MLETPSSPRRGAGARLLIQIENQDSNADTAIPRAIGMTLAWVDNFAGTYNNTCI
jgi:hypothetical protein